MPHPKTQCEYPAIPILALVESQRQKGEAVTDTARRLLIFEALAALHGAQHLAADRLGISRRRMNYWAEHYGIRPKDAVKPVDNP